MGGGIEKTRRFSGNSKRNNGKQFFLQCNEGILFGQELIKLPQSEWTCTRKKCLNKSKGRPKAKVEESTYKQLTKLYAPHNEIFYGLVKRYDFNWPKDWP